MLSTGHGVVRLVDRSRRVVAVHVASTRGLRRGTRVTIRGGKARVTGHVHAVTFYGRVVRSSKSGAVVRLADGSNLTLPASAGRSHAARGKAAAASVTINLQGLKPGQAVLVTLSTDAHGNVTLTIKLVGDGTNIGDGEQTVSGYITDDGGGGEFAISANGNGLRFSDPEQLLEAADGQQCDTVVVTYHKAGRRLVADGLRVTGQSTDGSCGQDQQGADGGGDEIDGTVTAIAADGSSITVDPGDGSGAQTIPVPDPSLLDGVTVGESVAVLTDDTGAATEIDALDDASSGDS